MAAYTNSTVKGSKMEQRSQGAGQGCQLFVGNLSTRISESELRELLEPFGPVKNVSVRQAHSIGASSGFAFVEMTDERTAARVIAELNGKSIDGRCLKVRIGF